MMTTDMDNNTLAGIAFWVAVKYGYEDVKATFEELPGQGLKWVRGQTFIELQVPDYFRCMDEVQMEDMLDYIMKKISKEEPSLPESVQEVLSSPDFARRHQATFLERHPSLQSNTRVDRLAKEVRDEGNHIPEGVAFVVDAKRSQPLIATRISSSMRVVVLAPKVLELNNADLKVVLEVAANAIEIRSHTELMKHPKYHMALAAVHAAGMEDL